ncbi:cellulose binding domain-containing protein [Plantactinospora sp. GCM10030261]|uniref:GH12 family glycosyl hydrolase domain-containing protein n=1 Tax=Plantactinospora sp. GCM10030261 TaxID=3273420 RepID=UPI0036173FA2
MSFRRSLAAALLIAAAGLVAPIAGATPAQADTRICEQYGSTTIQNRYVVQNNRWGSNAEQCINVTSTGFQIVSQQGSAPTNGAPLSYPSVFAGCHYTNCSPGTNLPRQLSQIASVNSSISYSYVGGTYNASYDIWLDPTPKTNGVNQMEIMIWFNRQGPIQPIGSRVGTTSVGGRSWEVWQGNNGGNDVVSYVAPSAISSWSFNVMDFVRDVDARTQVTTSWYLTSIQAGFEPWSGGVGLAVNSFSADVVPGSGDPGPGPGPGPGGCSATPTVQTQWNGGYVVEPVRVTNTGSSALNGWTVTFTLPSGQTLAGSWNANVTSSGQTVTARNVGYNGSLAPGASATFGLQVNRPAGSSTVVGGGFTCAAS